MAQTKKLFFTLPTAGPLYPVLSRDNAQEILEKAQTRLANTLTLDERRNERNIDADKICSLLTRHYKHPIPSLDWFVKNCEKAIQASSSMLPMTLYDWQQKHFDQILQVSKQFSFFFDLTQMGLGKTIISTMLAKTLGFPLIVIGPLTTEANWAKTAYRCGVELLGFYSYEGIRSVKGCQPAHGLLSREDYPEVTFTPTTLLRDLVKTGVVVIFDEFQKAKNESVQAHACQAISRYIVGEHGPSCVGFLSGTPFDKVEHVVSVYRALGMLTEKSVATYEIQTGMDYRGFNQLYSKFSTTFPKHPGMKQAMEDYEHIIRHNEKTAKIRSTIYRWAIDILFQTCSSSLPAPRVDHPLDIKNGYYSLDEETQMKIAIYFSELAKALGFEKGETVNLDIGALAAINKYMRLIEIAMAPTFARLAKVTLDKHPQSKVVMMFNYLESIKIVNDLLKDYQPLILTGEVPGKKRPGVIDQFQTDDRYRVFLSQLTVGGVGVSLHDTVGGRRRFMFLSPDYKAISLHQAVYRIHRVGVKSPAHVRMVFSEGNEGYRSLLNCLHRKAKILSELTPEQVKDGVKYPGDYPNTYERAVVVSDEVDTILFGQETDMDVLLQLKALRLD